MSDPIVINGTYAGRTFTPDEPLPDTCGRAQLVIVPAEQSAGGHSIWDAVGKLPQQLQRTAEDIDAQMREERDAWGDR